MPVPMPKLTPTPTPKPMPTSETNPKPATNAEWMPAPAQGTTDCLPRPAPTSDAIMRIRTYNGETKTWNRWETVLRRSEAQSPPAQSPLLFEYELKKKGKLRIYPSLLSLEEQQEVTQELLRNTDFFREYRIQGTKEPRAHFLLHENAPDVNIDDDSTESPGYKYGRITMKARPLSNLPHVQEVSEKLKSISDVISWNIGVDIVAYRDGHDSIGFHADDDQGEQLIFTALFNHPAKHRRVLFKCKPRSKDGGKDNNNRRRSSSKPNPLDGDEEIELLLGAGDAYSMDGRVQCSYVHGVPKEEIFVGDGDALRFAMVCRLGTFTKYTKDSGQKIDNLQPRAIIPQTFGQIKGLEEGKLYARSKLQAIGAHRYGNIMAHFGHSSHLSNTSHF